MAHITLSVADVMGWQPEEIALLTKQLNAYANLLGDEEKALDCVKTALTLESDFPAMHIDQWLKAVIKLIFYELTNAYKKAENSRK